MVNNSGTDVGAGEIRDMEAGVWEGDSLRDFQAQDLDVVFT
jgi:hypothetical protein